MAPRAPIEPPARPLGRRIVVLVVAAAALAVLIGSAMGERGYIEVARRDAAGADMKRQVEQLQADNAAMLADITALKRDPHVIEKLAREKLGYARPGEVIYLFPPKEQEKAQEKPQEKAAP